MQKIESETQDHPLWSTPFGRDYGPVIRQTTE